MPFDHEKLNVYQRALAFFGEVAPLIRGWDARHAITDHLPRAAESVMVNLAEACATFSKARFTTLDYSLGSTLECAACIDIAAIKALVDAKASSRMKTELAAIFRMLMGLRSAWGTRMVREEPTTYEAPLLQTEEAAAFHHEGLEVYRLSLEVMRLLSEVCTLADIPAPHFRKLDSAATGVVLNLAEGNGRFSALDHRRFLDVAYRAAFKLATQLDLCVQEQILDAKSTEELKQPLVSVANMIAAMRRTSEVDK